MGSKGHCPLVGFGAKPQEKTSVRKACVPYVQSSLSHQMFDEDFAADANED